MIVLISILFSSLSFAAATCSDAQTILSLSFQTNAHGEYYYKGNYDVDICYEDIFGTVGNGDHACNGNNKVVGLNYNTNAHAETPNREAYTENICYGNLQCVARDGGCNTDEKCVVVISGSTNAHLSVCGNPGANICCKEPNAVVIGNRFWANILNISINQANLGETIKMIVTQTGLARGSNLSFEIKEADTWPNNDDNIRVGNNSIIGTVNANGTAVAYWTITQADLDKTGDRDKFYFEVGGNSSGNLKVNIPLMFSREAYWAYENGNLRSIANLGERVKMIVNYTGLAEGTGVNFEIYEDDSWVTALGDDEIRVGTGAISGTVDAYGNAVAYWTITQADLDKTRDYEKFYFKVNGETSGDLEVNATEIQEYLCEDYSDEDRCGGCGDNCEIAVRSVEGKNSEVECGSTVSGEDVVGGDEDCDYKVICRCEWDDEDEECGNNWELEIKSGSCNNEEDYPFTIGKCSYSDQTTDNCDDGILEYSWSSLWVWRTDNDYDSKTGFGNPDDFVKDTNNKYHYDPQGLSLKCVGGRNIVPCPSKAQLPFFGGYQFVLSFLMILTIYFLFSIRRENEK